MEKKLEKNGLINKIYGGLNMSWISVILFAVGTAVLTAIFLIVPVFKGTSFEQMGVGFEAWIFFAVIIMANCKKPLESALKTFVFFVISQPLIYLIQVPFAGWHVLSYYRNWIIWTLLTIPMAYIGWFITKKNWISVPIFAPIFVYLGTIVYGSGIRCIHDFPHLLITAIFCLIQIVLYIAAFFPDMKQKIVGALVPIITVIVLFAVTPQVDIQSLERLPDGPSFSAEATITIDDDSIAEVNLQYPENGMIAVHAHAYGTATITVVDGEVTVQYTIEVYNESGIARFSITPVGQDGSDR